MTIDHDEIMRRVAAISPVLERNAGACDLARQVVPESIAAMMDAGMFRISQPSRNGGYELSLRTLADTVTALSQACPSTGMWASLAGCLRHRVRSKRPTTCQHSAWAESFAVGLIDRSLENCAARLCVRHFLTSPMGKSTPPRRVRLVRLPSKPSLIFRCSSYCNHLRSDEPPELGLSNIN
jgi:hypothetical protein